MNLRDATTFDWDDGNINKNEKQGVSPSEIERVFMNRPLLVVPHAHSQGEDRFAALGKTDEDRWLAVVFTLREEKRRIRPISARPMNRKERKIYEKAS